MKARHGMIPSALVLAGLLATACASAAAPAGTKAAAQVMPAMKAAVRAASSVHIAGTLADGSRKFGIDANINGSSLSGKVAVDGNSFSLVLVGGNGYVLLTPAYLKVAGLPSTACSTVCGKYVQLPAASVAQFTAVFSMSRLMSSMLSSMPSFAGDTSDLFKPATFHGHPVLRLIVPENAVDVARTGTPYPVNITSSVHGNWDGSLTFSGWNSIPPVTAPQPSQVVTASSL